MNKKITVFWKYILSHKIISIVLFYIALSVLIKIFFNIDICIPCLWKFLFNFKCPGCGITTAFIKLLQFNFRGAFQTNSLVFILLPFMTYYVLTDYYRFIKRFQ